MTWRVPHAPTLPGSVLLLPSARQAASHCVSAHCRRAPVLRGIVWSQKMSNAEFPTAPQQPLRQHQHLTCFQRFLLLIKKNTHEDVFTDCPASSLSDFYLTGKTKLTLKKLEAKQRQYPLTVQVLPVLPDSLTAKYVILSCCKNIVSFPQDLDTLLIPKTECQPHHLHSSCQWRR